MFYKPRFVTFDFLKENCASLSEWLDNRTYLGPEFFDIVVFPDGLLSVLKEFYLDIDPSSFLLVENPDPSNLERIFAFGGGGINRGYSFWGPVDFFDSCVWDSLLSKPLFEILLECDYFYFTLDVHFRPKTDWLNVVGGRYIWVEMRWYYNTYTYLLWYFYLTVKYVSYGICGSFSGGKTILLSPFFISDSALVIESS